MKKSTKNVHKNVHVCISRYSCWLMISAAVECGSVTHFSNQSCTVHTDPKIIQLKMKPKFVDCFMLIGTALSLNNSEKLPETGRPLIYEIETIFVNVSLTVEEIHFINIHNMEIQVTLLLHQRWIDPRLGANLQTRQMAIAGQIWRPKITITKGLIGNGINNEDTQFWRGFGEEGNVLLSEKIIIKTFCTRNFKRFPFDAQICELKFGTYRFPIDEVELVWHLNPAEVLTGVFLNEFELSNISTFHEVDVRPTGNFSVLVMQIIVKRYTLHYVICTMIPCVVLVLLTYISFWIDSRNIVIRLGLSLTVVLFLIYFYNVATCLTGSVPLLKLLDIFIILCLAFASFALCENCVVSYIFSDFDLDCVGKDLCNKKTSRKLFYWTERIIRIMFPLIYAFCLLLFAYCAI